MNFTEIDGCRHLVQNLQAAEILINKIISRKENLTTPLSPFKPSNEQIQSSKSKSPSLRRILNVYTAPITPSNGDCSSVRSSGSQSQGSKSGRSLNSYNTITTTPKSKHRSSSSLSHSINSHTHSYKQSARHTNISSNNSSTSLTNTPRKNDFLFNNYQISSFDDTPKLDFSNNNSYHFTFSTWEDNNTNTEIIQNNGAECEDFDEIVFRLDAIQIKKNELKNSQQNSPLQMSRQVSPQIVSRLVNTTNNTSGNNAHFKNHHVTDILVHNNNTDYNNQPKHSQQNSQQIQHSQPQHTRQRPHSANSATRGGSFRCGLYRGGDVSNNKTDNTNNYNHCSNNNKSTSNLSPRQRKTIQSVQQAQQAQQQQARQAIQTQNCVNSDLQDNNKQEQSEQPLENEQMQRIDHLANQILTRQTQSQTSQQTPQQAQPEQQRTSILSSLQNRLTTRRQSVTSIECYDPSFVSISQQNNVEIEQIQQAHIYKNNKTDKPLPHIKQLLYDLQMRVISHHNNKERSELQHKVQHESVTTNEVNEGVHEVVRNIINNSSKIRPKSANSVQRKVVSKISFAEQ